ncbi:hypothetical protein NA56DRAFT_445830 [Hyaloscypha hepaticicola]|uniref:Uncharacterized protein n=1 Tax=Hyaloscypha hepaticicola TaxID=2082293 RepID=A0A2J6PG32_9HELO|nr:hypothetical protein NA56DRAFT_445830 [Hyaloscypha hepaticicola]
MRTFWRSDFPFGERIFSYCMSDFLYLVSDLIISLMNQFSPIYPSIYLIYSRQFFLVGRKSGKKSFVVDLHPGRSVLTIQKPRNSLRSSFQAIKNSISPTSYISLEYETTQCSEEQACGVCINAAIFVESSSAEFPLRSSPKTCMGIHPSINAPLTLLCGC